LPPEAVRRLLGNEAIIGYSTHSVEQAQHALALPVDYIAIGPIFATSSKSDTSPTLGIEGLRAVRKVAGNFPLVALGGVSHANAGAVIEAGADSVAVISALLCDPARITDATRALLQSLSPPQTT
jgi:thiamine-phosphate pyrophosphorylase